jgi:hypothetical protein
MKKIILLIALVVVAISVNAQTNNISTLSSTGGVEYNSSTKTFKANKAIKSKTPDIQTDYKYQDKKGNEYPIWISKRGRCYIKKTNKDGEETRQYLGEEISRKVATNIGIEYKEKSKS